MNDKTKEEVTIPASLLNVGLGWLRRTFWRHCWYHPANGNPYRRFCSVCGEQQELDRYWFVWNKGDHKKHWMPNVVLTPKMTHNLVIKE